MGKGTNKDNSAIKKEEKEQIKIRALQAGIMEPAPVLALQNALMIAKIMRYEFPNDWYVLNGKLYCMNMLIYLPGLMAFLRL